jgi:transportin-1
LLNQQNKLITLRSSSPIHLQSFQQLEHYKALPDFNNYLAFIFASGDGLSVEVRQSAGLLLKNNVRNHFSSFQPEAKAVVKIALLNMMGNDVKPLRQTAGSCIASMIGVEGFQGWPEVLGGVTAAIESGELLKIEGAVDMLYKLAEEQPAQMEMSLDGNGQTASDVLIPRMMSLFGNPNPEVRALSVGFINLLSGFGPRALMASMDVYLQGLFTLAVDSSPAVRKNVCSSLVQSLYMVPERLEPSMPQLIEYMLQCTQDSDKEIALESCEFWTAFGESQIDPAVLRPFLPRILPVLLNNMVFDEYDEEVEDAEAAEEMALKGNAHRDRDHEIKPHIHKGAKHGAAEEEEDDEEDEIGQWNLRRSSAAGLDMLSTVFGDELLPIILPIVQGRLVDLDWRAKESAILALGAISQGCATGLLPHLPGMLQMLLPGLKDPRPLVRSISSWSISRYSKWFFDRAEETGQPAELDSIVHGICGGILDHNRKVQEAACASIGAICAEERVEAMSSYMHYVCKTLTMALGAYGRRSMHNLYDAIMEVAEHMYELVNLPENACVLFPPLFRKFEEMHENDKDILSLMDTLTNICPSAQGHLEEFANATFNKCLGMIQRYQEARQSGAYDADEAAEYIVASLDLLSALVEGLGTSFEALMVRSNLAVLVAHFCSDGNVDVRQSAFALVGDLTKICHPYIIPVTKEIVPSALAHLEAHAINQSTLDACNNACWCIGEMITAYSPQEITEAALPLLERLVNILTAPAGGLPRGMKQNASITLGRLAWKCTEQVSPHAGHFMSPWCLTLRGVRDDIEKKQAFHGICAILRLNPQAASNSFGPLCEAIVSWRRLPDDLLSETTQIMQCFKQQLVSAGQWQQALASLNPSVAEKLRSVCQL